MSILILLIAFMAFLCYFYRLLKANFWCRGKETSGFTDYFLQNHPELTVKPYECRTKDGYLGGWLISMGSSPAGLIVMTHGYGRTLEHYLPEAGYFAHAGFMVLLFDGTGFGKSSGRWMRGLPQHVLDMEAVLNDISKDTMLSALPLFLYGHSWGAYAANAVSCRQSFPIRGIISVAAYNDALTVVRQITRNRYGRLASLVLQLFKFYNFVFFGKVSDCTSAAGLKALSCPMLICHSRDDSVVPYEENYLPVYQALQQKENAFFMEMDHRNHNILTPPKIDVIQRQLIHELAENYSKETEHTLWQMQSVTDTELLAEFADFYIMCLSVSDQTV